MFEFNKENLLNLLLLFLVIIVIYTYYNKNEYFAVGDWNRIDEIIASDRLMKNKKKVTKDIKKATKTNESVKMKSCTNMKNVRLPGGGFQYGGDYDHIAPYPITNVSIDACRASCYYNPQCKQYVYYKPKNGSQGVCYMMNNAYPYNRLNPDQQTTDFESGQCSGNEIKPFTL